MKKVLILSAGVSLLGTVYPNVVQATSFSQDLSASSPEGLTYNLTGNYADQRFIPANTSNGTWINPSNFSNILSDPNVPTGTSFQGVAYFFKVFSIPDDATDINLSLIAGADDQVKVDLNGYDLGAYKLFLNNQTFPVQGKMTDANLQQIATAFLPNNTPISFDNQSIFNKGDNVLRFWYNNTFNAFDANAPATPMVASVDGAILNFEGTVSYKRPVPLPAMIPGVILASTFGVWRTFKAKNKNRKTSI